MGVFTTPFIVPLGAFAVAMVAIVAGVVGQAHSRRVKAEQRMAMLARGVPLAEIEQFMNRDRDREERMPSTPTRRLANSRRTAVVLVSVGVGIMLFGFALSVILGERDVLSLCAVGLVPLAIGVGFLADYRMQMAEIQRLGLPVE